MTALRFCMLTTFYPPHSFGGDAIGLQRLSRGLVRRGHHVTVVHDVDAYNALHHGPEPDEDVNAGDGVHAIRLRSGYGVFSPILTQQLGRPVLNRKRLSDILRPGAFDVVNFHNVSLIGGPGLFRYGSDAVRVYMAHEHWLVCPSHVLWRHNREVCDGRQCIRCVLRFRRPPQYWRYTGLLERESRHVDAFIAMSEFSRQKHREFGFSRDMEVLPYFLPDPGPGDSPGAFGAAPQERPYFLFAGRLERIKGLDDVIPVFRDFHDADLLIAGDGEHEDALRAVAAGMANVKFLGRVTPEQLRRFYQHAVATLVPSICYETFGIVLIEAFRQGTPVIARRLGPLPEIVAQSGGGELFDSPESLRLAMRRLIDDPAHRSRLAESGYRAYVERWTESVVVPQYLDIVRRAAQRRGHLGVMAALSAASAA